MTAERASSGALPPLPAAFPERMHALLGEREASALLAALQAPPVRGLRVNTLKVAPARLRELLPWSLSPVPWCGDGFVVDDPEAAPGRHPLHAAGAFYLQDPSAMAPAEVLAPNAGERVLDLAAAPGGKSTHLAALMQGRGLLVANDADAERAGALIANLERWGTPHAVVTSATPERLARSWGPSFDRVLLDAPCSGEGMFRKSPQARRQWQPALVAGCARTQAQLLDAAARLLRPGGLLAYSTCTFERVENEGAVEAFLARHPEFRAEPFARPGLEPGLAGPPPRDAVAGTARLWPFRQPADGHFVALLRKLEPAADEAGGPPRWNVRGAYGRAGDPPAAGVRAWQSFAQQVLGGVPFEGTRLLLHGERLLAVPPELPPAHGLHLLRVGVALGRLRGERFEPAHALALAAPLGGEGIDLRADDPRVARFLARLPFPDGGPDGWTRVNVEGLALGWGRRRAAEVRSLLPAGLARSRRPDGSDDG